MAKTLSESAAEILNASIGKNQEPAAKLAQFQDLGGATPEDDYSGNPGHTGDDESEDADRADDSVGKAAAAGVQVAPRPVAGGKAAPQEGMGSVRSQGLAQPVVGSTNVYSGAVAEEVESDEEVIEEEEMTAEDIAEAKKQWIKEKIAARKGTMVEDVNALFNGESLSEEFRGKATVIFEAAVMSRVETILEDVLADNDQVLEESVDSIKSELTEQVDEYMNYVVEQWMQENQVAVDSGLRAELSEEFINGLKGLFEQHYIELPEEKVDVAEELAEQLVAMEEAAAIREQEFAAVTKELNEAKKTKAMAKVCEGLTQVQASKMISLAEGVEFTTEGDYKHKLAVIRESYFPTKQTVQSEVKKVIQETSLDEPKEVVKASGLMSHYVNAISKTAPKF